MGDFVFLPEFRKAKAIVTEKDQPKPAAEDAVVQTGLNRRLKALTDELDELEEQVN